MRLSYFCNKPLTVTFWCDKGYGVMGLGNFGAQMLRFEQDFVNLVMVNYYKL